MVEYTQLIALHRTGHQDDMKTTTQQIALRLPKPLVRKLDQWIRSQAHIGARFSRTAVVRDLICQHLTAAQATNETQPD
jgi:metal-responsive CopG/Arc/MetJ family transcriptional regulator